MSGLRHKCLATLGLVGATADCTAMLKAEDTTFAAPDASPNEVSPSVRLPAPDVTLALSALGCLDQAHSTTSGDVDVTFIAFDRSQFYNFATDDMGQPVHLTTYTAQPGTSIQGCAREDAVCASPTTSEVVTDASGSARLLLPGSFDGFFRIRRAGALSGNYYPKLPSGQPSVTLFVSAVTDQQLAKYAGQFSLPTRYDPSQAALVILDYDCQDRPLAGATIDLNVDAGFASYHMSSSEETGTTGARVFFDVPEGDVTVSSSLRETGRLLGLRSLNVRSGDLTVADFRLR